MNKIKSISKKFRIIFQIACVVIPIFNLVVWIFYERLPKEITLTLLPHSLNLDQININTGTKLLVCLVSMMEISIVLYALNQLIRLFKNYEQNIIFSLSNVICYKKLGISIFIWVVFNKIAELLISFILTFQNTAGHRMIAVRFDAADLAALAVGGVIILIAWIMNEGHKLEEEQALII